MSRSPATSSRSTAVAHTAEQHALTLVLDPEDDLATLRQLRALHARPLGQIVCEPSPATGLHDLAHHLLRALGKTPGGRDHAWSRAQAHLEAEMIEHLVLLRAHVLDYPALRRIADCTLATGARLWLAAAGDIATRPIRQLLELRPHATATLEHLTASLNLGSIDEPDDLPTGRGLDFPLLPQNTHRRTRTQVSGVLRGRPRSTVLELYDAAHTWTTDWLEARPQATEQETADAVYRLAQASTASETIARASGGLRALADAGCAINTQALDCLNRDEWFETRPQHHHHLAVRAAAISDRCPDPADAALIALGAICQCRYRLRHIQVRDLAPDAAMLLIGSILAVPPPLRAALRAQRTLAHAAGGPHGPLLTGPSGQPNQRTMRACYQRHAVPASLRVQFSDEPQLTADEIYDGFGDDGANVLYRLNPANLFTH